MSSSRFLVNTNTTEDDDTTNNNTTVDGWRYYMPVILSLLAGLSTCIGAAIVFCVGGGSGSGNNNNKKQQKRRRLGHSEMAFSLSLAGSVMITVSVTSLLPESMTSDDNDNDNNEWIPLVSKEFGMRCLSLGIGCGLYMLLSKCAFPEPDSILGWEHENGDNYGDDNNNNNMEMNILSKKQQQQQTQQQQILALSRSSSENSDNSRKTGGSKHSYVFQRKRNSRQNSYDGSDDLENDSALISTDGDDYYDNDDDDLNHNNDNDDNDDDEDEVSALLRNHIDDNYDNGKPPKTSSISISTSKKQPQSKSKSSFATSFSGADLQTDEARRAWRVAMLLFVSLAVHNFPEGLAVAASTMYSVHLGWTTTIAIALHNIPEGIAIAVPCLKARPDSPWLAFGLASISGLAEPLGAAVAMGVLGNHPNKKNKNNQDEESFFLFNMKNVLAFVAGIMTMVAILDLFPEAFRHSRAGKRIPLISGTVVGIVVMVASEAYLDS